MNRSWLWWGGVILWSMPMGAVAKSAPSLARLKTCYRQCGRLAKARRTGCARTCVRKYARRSRASYARSLKARYSKKPQLKVLVRSRPQSTTSLNPKYPRKPSPKLAKGLNLKYAKKLIPTRVKIVPVPRRPTTSLAARVTACYRDCGQRYPGLAQLLQRQECGRPCAELARSAAGLSLSERVAVCRADCAGRSFGPLGGLAAQNCNAGCNLLARSGGQATPPGTSPQDAACATDCRRRNPDQPGVVINTGLAFCMLNCRSGSSGSQASSGCRSWSTTVMPGCLTECRRLYRGSRASLLSCSAGCGIAVRLARQAGSRP